MAQEYTPTELETLARHTARAVGCDAVRWWFAGQDRTRLHIEGKQVLPNGEELRVLLEAPVLWSVPPVRLQPPASKALEVASGSPTAGSHRTGLARASLRLAYRSAGRGQPVAVSQARVIARREGNGKAQCSGEKGTGTAQGAR